MDGPAAALLVTAGSHVAGAVFLIWYLLRQGADGLDMRRWWYGDEGGEEPWPSPPEPTPSGEGLPLPDAAPASVRLRGRRHLRDAYPRPARRPRHAPQPAPVHERERT